MSRIYTTDVNKRSRNNTKESIPIKDIMLSHLEKQKEELYKKLSEIEKQQDHIKTLENNEIRKEMMETINSDIIDDCIPSKKVSVSEFKKIKEKDPISSYSTDSLGSQEIPITFLSNSRKRSNAIVQEDINNDYVKLAEKFKE